jgi:DNA adenine methylase
MSEPQAGEDRGPGHGTPGDVKLTPFLKWPGGKRWLVSMCPDVFPSEFDTYIEPFLGAASVYFHIRPQKAILGDLNEDLIAVYHGVKEDPAAVQVLLEKHQAAHCRDYYYEVRNMEPESLSARAARIIYLNRTCFNGIYRVNRQGKFNVPIGERDQVVRHADDFLSVAALLVGAELHQGDFEQLVGRAQPGDLVFLDPPYTVRHNRNGFIKYNERLFSWGDQERLARTAAAAAQRGAHVVVTNASHPTVRQLYPEELFTFREVSRYSSISASVDSRKHFDELIISSREVGGIREARRFLCQTGVPGDAARRADRLP